MADVVSWVSKPCRCLFHITPVIPNCHFIPSSLLFFLHNSESLPKWRLFSSGVATQQWSSGDTQHCHPLLAITLLKV